MFLSCNIKLTINRSCSNSASFESSFHPSTYVRLYFFKAAIQTPKILNKTHKRWKNYNNQPALCETVTKQQQSNNQKHQMQHQTTTNSNQLM
jgi:hypothetical protein